MRWLYRLVYRRSLRRGYALDHAHEMPGGDRVPIGNDEWVRLLVRREWS